MATMLDNGVRVRWLNTAGFEMVLPGGAHLLVDPWLDSSDVYPFPLKRSSARTISCSRTSTSTTRRT